MLWFAACLISATLLWLGPEIGAAAAPKRSPLAWGMKACALALVSAGLWWPAHLIGGLATHAMPPPAFAWLAGLALAFLATLSAGAATRKTLSVLVGFALLTMLLAYGHSILVTPGLVGVLLRVADWSPGIAAMIFAAALIGLHLDFKTQRQAWIWRAGLALAVAAMLTAAAAATTPSDAVAGSHPVNWPEAPLLAGLMLVAGVLVKALSAARKYENEMARPSPTLTMTVDGLTKLPTRLYFEDRLVAAAAKADAKADRLALLFVDLDGFKPVNDTYGHSVGDRVLEQVGQRLKTLSRGHNVVARIGGDEFLLLLTQITNDESVAHVARRLVSGLSQAYVVDGREVIISCSVGIALYPGCGHGKLITRADAAMYSAKRSGGSTYCFYSPTMEVDAERHFDLLRDLRKALLNQEMELFYQPKIDVKSGKVTATEALLRWKHPTRGVLLPSVFIPIAERFGLIVAIGNWVIEDACRQSRSWRDNGLRMRVAINLSAHQMRQDDIVQRITETLHRHGIHPSLLTCEITESAAMEDTKATQETFRRLGELGTHLSIDDFGTGYSSLSYLRKLPAEELKIDRSFVTDLEHSTDARAVVDAVIKLAHALGLKVVAEGVETERQRQILVDMACDEMQGFLFAKPMSAHALQLWAINDRTESAVFRSSLFSEPQPEIDRI